MAASSSTTVNTSAARMKTYENFVKIQADAALRRIAGEYAYDNVENHDEVTLRSSGDVVQKRLEAAIAESLELAGIEVLEARISHLAYAPEIAAVMLRRQQADAILSARHKIVEGAVDMVHMALERLKEENVVELDEDKKAAMVSNLVGGALRRRIGSAGGQCRYAPPIMAPGGQTGRSWRERRGSVPWVSWQGAWWRWDW